MSCPDDNAFCVDVMYICIDVFNTILNSTSHCTSCWYIMCCSVNTTWISTNTGTITRSRNSSTGVYHGTRAVHLLSSLSIVPGLLSSETWVNSRDYLSFMWSEHFCQLTWSNKLKLVIIATYLFTYLFMCVFLFVCSYLLSIRTTGTSLLAQTCELYNIPKWSMLSHLQ